MRKILALGLLALILVVAFSVARITGFLNMTFLPQSCEDSDHNTFFKEKGFYEKGETIIRNSPSYVTANYSDYCIDDYVLAEYYCKWSYRDGAFIVKRMFYECPNGCSDGECN